MQDNTVKRDKNSIGLWKKTARSGKAYLSGSTDHYWVSYFKNERKELQSEPDGVLKFYPKDKEDRNYQEYGVGLFKQTSKGGVDYASGKRGTISYAIFANTKKTQENQPDYRCLVDEYTTADVKVGAEDPEQINLAPDDSDVVASEDPGPGDADIPFDEDDIPF
jgi:hypothetical protein